MSTKTKRATKPRMKVNTIDPDPVPDKPVGVRKQVVDVLGSGEMHAEKMARLERYVVPLGTGPRPPEVDGRTFKVGDLVKAGVSGLFGGGTVVAVRQSDVWYRPEPFGPEGHHQVQWLTVRSNTKVYVGGVDETCGIDVAAYQCVAWTPETAPVEVERATP